VKLFKNNNNENKTYEKSNKGFLDKAWDLQHRLEARQQRIGKGKYGRVLKMARKPTNEEYSKTSKITAIGILLIGGLGFLIFLIVTIGAPWVAEQLGLI
jgi:protein transport protein SEC61 subunit gamma-like protein